MFATFPQLPTRGVDTRDDDDDDDDDIGFFDVGCCDCDDVVAWFCNNSLRLPVLQAGFNTCVCASSLIIIFISPPSFYI
jgi:hypothetical protein